MNDFGIDKPITNIQPSMFTETGKDRMLNKVELIAANNNLTEKSKVVQNHYTWTNSHSCITALCQKKISDPANKLVKLVLKFYASR